MVERNIAEMGVDREGGYEWNFGWRRRLFVWEENLLLNLTRDLHGFERVHGEDEWCWKSEEKGIFSVSSMYRRLEETAGRGNAYGEVERRVFGQAWKSPAPSKVVAFSWKLLLNRIPTRLNLAYRNVLPSNANLRCVFCDLEDESTRHLFLHCRVSWNIWTQVQIWLALEFISPPDFFTHWLCWIEATTCTKKMMRGMNLIWHTVDMGDLESKKQRYFQQPRSVRG
jgi:hypothetical protein